MKSWEMQPRPATVGRVMLVLAGLLGLLLGAVAPGGSLAQAGQEGTPDAQAPLIIDEPDESTPAVDGASLIEEEPAAQDEPATSEESVGPDAAIAQGLIYLDGSAQVWQVLETSPASASDAAPFTAEPGFFFQRAGDIIVRNDLSGKRAKLEPGEAYFTSSGDPYTAYAAGTTATSWSIDLVEPSAVAEDAFYESPVMEDLPTGTFDLELIRIALGTGDAADLPEHTGPALIMVTSGTVDVESEGASGALSENDGQLVPGAASVVNDSADPAVIVVAAFGDQVEDEGPAAAAAEPTPAPAEETTDAPVAEEEPSPAEATEPAAEQTAPTDGTTGDAQAGATSIAVTANAPVYVEVVADGETVFAGELAAGETTGQVAGSAFRVYTTSGVSTVFTNACGDSFQMGFEEGEATYELSANADSCPPA